MKKLTILTIAAIVLAGGPASARPSAYSALLQAFTITARARTFTADVTFKLTQSGTTITETGTVHCLKPEFLRYDLWPVPGPRTASTPHKVVVTDGKHYWRLTGVGSTETGAAPKNADDLDNLGLVQSFFMHEPLLPAAMKSACRWSGSEKLDGTSYNVVTMSTPSGATSRFDVGADGLIHRITADGEGLTADLIFRHVRINVPMTAANFRFTAPVDTAAWVMPKADAKSRSVIERITHKLQSTPQLTAEYQETLALKAGAAKPRSYGWDAVIKLMKPNYLNANVTLLPSGQAAEPAVDKCVHQVSDGVSYWNLWDEADKYYTKAPTAASGHDLRIPIFQQELGAFFDTAQNLYGVDSDQSTVLSVKYVGVKNWQGAPYDVLTFVLDPGQGMREVDTVFVGADDLIHRLTSRITSHDGALDVVDTLSKLDTTTQLAKADFAFVPPAGAVEKAADADTGGDEEQPVIGDGVAAPDFSAQGVDGKPIKLSDLRGQVVVLDMWATWCGPCQISLPSTNATARKYKGKGVVVLALNVMDSTEAFKQWLPSHKALDAMTFAVDPSGQDSAIPAIYQVSAIPTQFVIGKDGKVLKSFVGFSGSDEDLTAAINSALAAPDKAPGNAAANSTMPPAAASKTP